MYPCTWASGKSTYNKSEEQRFELCFSHCHPPCRFALFCSATSLPLTSRAQGIALGFQTQVSRPSFFTFVVSTFATSSCTRVLGLVAAALTTKMKNKGLSSTLVIVIHHAILLPSVVPSHFLWRHVHKVLPLGFKHRLADLCSSLLS